MRKRTTTVTLVAGVAVLALADAASAYYSPRLGRFINRDPLNEPGAKLMRSHQQPTAFIPRDPIRGERISSPLRFSRERSLGSPSASMDPNLYAFVRNQPISLLDPLGLAPANGSPDCDACIDECMQQLVQGAGLDLAQATAICESNCGCTMGNRWPVGPSVCCRPSQGLDGGIFLHCEIKWGGCQWDDTAAYPVTRDYSPTRRFWYISPYTTICTSCAQATDAQVQMCIRRYYDAGNGTPWNNCQSNTSFALANCCLKTTWTPSSYAIGYAPPCSIPDYKPPPGQLP